MSSDSSDDKNSKENKKPKRRTKTAPKKPTRSESSSKRTKKSDGPPRKKKDTALAKKKKEEILARKEKRREEMLARKEKKKEEMLAKKEKEQQGKKRKRNEPIKPVDCVVCGKPFSYTANLKRHMYKDHPKEARELCPNMKDESRFQCAYCTRQYKKPSQVKFHERRDHKIPDDPLKYPCEICPEKFSSKKKRKFHVTHTHKELPQHHRICMLCGVQVLSKDIEAHFKNDHQIELETTTMEFTNMKEFNTWKESEEKATFTMYVVKSAGGTNKSKKKSFRCHRSGFFNSRSTGKEL